MEADEEKTMRAEGGNEMDVTDEMRGGEEEEEEGTKKDKSEEEMERKESLSR